MVIDLYLIWRFILEDIVKTYALYGDYSYNQGN